MKNVFRDMEIMIDGEIHFAAHDGCCMRCGRTHPTTEASPAGTFTDDEE
jgi:hypothetical protein